MGTHRLPHIYPEDRWLFLTWSLHGSLPASHFPPPTSPRRGKPSFGSTACSTKPAPVPYFFVRSRSPRWWAGSLRRGVALGHYDLGSWVIMGNHVHALLLPRLDPSRLLKSLKGATAREANRLLRRTGEPFWQRESFDHWVRSQQERYNIGAYIEHNPVKAGIVSRPDQYRWSSAWPG